MTAVIEAAKRVRYPEVKDLRETVLSMLVGIAVLFIMNVGRGKAFTGRFVIYGALVGFWMYLCCRLLYLLLGARIDRRQILPKPVVAAVVFFIGGVLGWGIATAIAQTTGLTHLHLAYADLRITAGLTGGLGLAVGLAFYSFGLLEQRLRDNVARLKEAEFAEKELELARAIQQRLLPPAEIEASGFRISARNLPARYVAGDFYDVFPLPDGKLGLVVADVSGKGIGSALIMASVKAVVPLLAAERSAAATLTALNRELSGKLAPREFVALCFARFDPRDGSLEIANAGLPDPYQLRDGDAKFVSVPGSRFPLGARTDVSYEGVRLSLAAGDRILFLTDGIPETPISDGEPLGYDALTRMVGDWGAEKMPLDSLVDRVRRASFAPLADDWTVLLLERRPGTDRRP